MNIFNDDENQNHQDDYRNHPFFNLPAKRKQRIFIRPQSSNVDGFLTNSEEILKRAFKIILCGAGIISILIILFPYYRLLIEWCWWAFKKSGTLF